jgi:hypothetical protein
VSYSQSHLKNLNRLMRTLKIRLTFGHAGDLIMQQRPSRNFQSLGSTSATAQVAMSMSLA